MFQVPSVMLVDPSRRFESTTIRGVSVQYRPNSNPILPEGIEFLHAPSDSIVKLGQTGGPKVSADKVPWPKPLSSSSGLVPMSSDLLLTISAQPRWNSDQRYTPRLSTGTSQQNKLRRKGNFGLIAPHDFYGGEKREVAIWMLGMQNS